MMRNLMGRTSVTTAKPTSVFGELRPFVFANANGWSGSSQPVEETGAKAWLGPIPAARARRRIGHAVRADALILGVSTYVKRPELGRR
jgi:hypothetical protein